MNKNQFQNIFFFTVIVVVSFFLYSSRFYPLLNSDDALNILMTYYYDLPNDFYCWGQDRGGTFIPLISQIFHKTFGFSAVLSVSFSNYFVLLIGYLGFSSLFKSKKTKLLFALVWFFPPIRFIDLTRFPIGVQYSLIGISIYLINRIDFANKKKIYNHLLLVGIILSLSISIWVSDLAIVTITMLVTTLFVFHFFIDKRKNLNKHILFYGGLGIVAIIFFIKHAKSYATAITTNYKEFNDWETLKGAFDILKREFIQVFSFQNNELFYSIYAWLLLAFCLFLIISNFNKQFFNVLKSNKWFSFFVIDFFAILGVILLSKWVYLNGMGRWYFVTSYISVSLVILLLFDNTQFGGIKRNIITSFLFITITVGSLSTIHYLKFIRPKRLSSQIKARSEFLSLGEIGIIGEFWNSYVSACPDPSRIKATAHDKSGVRNQRLVDEVFTQPNLYVIKDMWLKNFPDTLFQFGYILKKNGEPFRLGDCDVNKYEKIKRNHAVKFEKFKYKPSVLVTEETLTILKDSTDVKNSFAVWGPYIPMGIGDFLLQIKLLATNNEEEKPIAFVDIASDYGKYVLAKKELTINDTSSDSINFELEFSCKKRLHNVEFRFYNYGTADIEIKEIRLIEK
jgi:hypothetical protein